MNARALHAHRLGTHQTSPTSPKAMPEPASSATVIIGAMLAALASMFAAIMPERVSSVTEHATPPLVAAIAPGTAESATTTTVNVNVSIMDDSRFRLVCIAGAFCGAILSVAVSRREDVRTMARRFIASVISGAVFTPLLMTKMGWQHTTDSILACSGGVSLMSWGILLFAVPLASRLFERWFESKFKMPEDTRDKL